MCYSLYLTHWPVVKLVSHLLYLAGVRGLWPTLALTTPVCIAVSVAVAWAFHLLVERRFLNTPPLMPHVVLAKAAEASSHKERQILPQPGQVAPCQ
jgi:peptidoglycan/LPS O-acetylase OafA/YrhL